MRLKVPTKFTLSGSSNALNEAYSGLTLSLSYFYSLWQSHVCQDLLQCGRIELPGSVVSVGLNQSLL